MNRSLAILSTACMLSLLAACGTDMGREKSHGPIVLGDSSTIVTETDSSKLRDMVTDLNPDIPSRTTTEDSAVEADQQDQPAATTDTAAAAIAASNKTATLQQPAEQPAKPAANAPATGNGLKMAFQQVTLFIPNIVTKTYHNQNLQNANGATYQLTGGNLNGNTLQVLSGNVTKVAMRYMTLVTLKDGNDLLPLDNLTHTTNWQEVHGRGNSYAITGLQANRLELPDVSATVLRSAISRAARRHRYSRAEEREVLNDNRTVNKRNLVATLHAVMWKVDGKDSRGHQYSKQVRIDLP